jgi:hypothetical protein
MSELRGWMIYSWIALPTMMYGGYSLLQLLNKANAIIPFRLTCFRAGDAHAGVLLEQSSCVSIAMLMLVSKVVRMRMTYHLTPTEF